MNANFNRIAQDLVQQLVTRFPSMKKATIDNQPIDGKKLTDADVRKISFDFTDRRNGEKMTNVSISLSDADEKPAMSVLWNKNPKDDTWMDFLDELGDFAQRNSLDFDLQNPTQTNLDKRDPIGEDAMTESRLFGTSKTSYQNMGEATIIVKHSAPVNFNAPNGRTQHIDSIFIENSVGERFRYPVKHLNGARALAQHVAHGGTPYDSIGQHVIGLSEELSKLRVFKNYVDRNEMVSEAMGSIQSKVIERIDTIKKQVHSLQTSRNYESFAESFIARQSKDIPEDILNDWIDRLTVRTFNEELKSVFPYIYSLVDESEVPIKDLDPNDLLGEEQLDERATPEWLDLVAKAKELLAKGMTPDQVAKQLGVQEPKNDMAGPLGGKWGAINSAQRDLQKQQKPAFETLEDKFESFLNKIVKEDDDIFRDDERGEQAMEKLKELFAEELPIGTNGNNVVSSLKGIIDNNKLERAFELLADLGLDELDSRELISSFLKAHDAKNDTDLAAQLGFGDEVAPPTEEPAAEAPPAEAPPAPPAEAPAAEAPPTPAAAPAEQPAPPPVAEEHEEILRKEKRPKGKADKLFGEIADRVSGFFNANEGTMTIGEEGFVTKMCKELKEKYNIEPDTMRAERFDSMVERACHQIMEKYKESHMQNQEHARMLELAGIKLDEGIAQDAGNVIGKVAGAPAAAGNWISNKVGQAWDAVKSTAQDFGTGVQQGYAQMTGGQAATPAPKAPTTPEEIKAFQQANGLKADGIIGPKTIAAMKAAGIEPPATAPRAPAQAAPKAQAGAQTGAASGAQTAPRAPAQAGAASGAQTGSTAPAGASVSDQTSSSNTSRQGNTTTTTSNASATIRGLDMEAARATPEYQAILQKAAKFGRNSAQAADMMYKAELAKGTIKPPAGPAPSPAVQSGGPAPVRDFEESMSRIRQLAGL